MGQGSIQRYEGKRGTTYGYVIEIGRGPGGRRLQKRRRGYRTKKAAAAAMQEELTERRHETHVEPSREPAAAYFARWLTETESGRLPATNRAYRASLARIAPHIGAIPLGSLTALDLSSAYRTLLGAGYAPSTVRHTHLVVRIAIRQAVRWRLIRHDVAQDVTLSAVNVRRPTVWTSEEAARFLAETDNDADSALWRLLLDSAVRIGEALALTWDDVDLESGTVSIRRTLTRGANGGTVVGTTTKTRSSLRTLAIAPATVAALTRHRASQDDRRRQRSGIWQETGIVFDRGDGVHRTGSAPAKRLSLLCELAGVPRQTPHGLRHTTTTLMIAGGVPMKVVADRLGHSTTALTDQLYAHATIAGDRAASEAFAAILERFSESS